MSEELQRAEALQFDLLTWYEVNKRRVFAFLGCLVLVAAALILWRGYRQSAREKSSGDLLTVTTLNKGSVPLAELDGVIARHPGTLAAAQAQVLAAKELFQQGRYADARARFESVAAGQGGDDLLATAQFGVASCLDAENKPGEAISAYQRVIDFTGAAHLAGLARLTKARLHESQGQPREALALYDAILKMSGAAVLPEATQLRAALLRAHPELETKPVSSNAPVAPTK